MTKNPKWSFPELVLAMELYMIYRPNPPGKNSRDVSQLSMILRMNALADGLKLTKTFRNKNGLAMKLQNFRRFDENFKGYGLRAGGNLENEIWDKYQNLNKLKKTADKIRNNIKIKIDGLKNE